MRDQRRGPPCQRAAGRAEHVGDSACCFDQEFSASPARQVDEQTRAVLKSLVTRPEEGERGRRGEGKGLGSSEDGARNGGCDGAYRSYRIGLREMGRAIDTSNR